MTEKKYRVICDEINAYSIFKDNDRIVFDLLKYDAERICDELNKIVDKNEQLKKEYHKLRHSHSLLHDICLNTEYERDSLKQDVKLLEKENEWLNQEMGNLGTTHAEEISKIEDEFDEEILKLERENKRLKQQLNDKEIVWLRNNTVWEQMPTNKRTVSKTSMKGDKHED